MSEEKQTNGQPQEEVELSAGDKKLKLRGSDLLTSVIGMIVCTGLGLLWYSQSEHRVDAKDHGVAVVQAIKEMTNATKDSVHAQRTMNCILVTEQKDRARALDTCERLTR